MKHPFYNYRVSMCLDLDYWFYNVLLVTLIFWISIQKILIILDKILAKIIKVVAFYIVIFHSLKRQLGNYLSQLVLIQK